MTKSINTIRFYTLLLMLNSLQGCVVMEEDCAHDVLEKLELRIRYLENLVTQMTAEPVREIREKTTRVGTEAYQSNQTSVTKRFTGTDDADSCIWEMSRSEVFENQTARSS